MLISKDPRVIRNREARLYRPSLTINPTEIAHIQLYVRWAIKYKVSLTVVGGGHSGHCVQSDVVAIKMEAFDQIHIVKQ